MNQEPVGLEERKPERGEGRGDAGVVFLCSSVRRWKGWALAGRKKSLPHQRNQIQASPDPEST